MGSMGSLTTDVKINSQVINVSTLRFRIGLWRMGLLAGAGWIAAALVTDQWPDASLWDRTSLLATLELLVAGALILTSIVSSQLPLSIAKLQRLGPWLLAFPLLLTAWEIVTAKLALLPLPFFAPPQSVLQVYIEDWPRLGASVMASVLLLIPAYFIGVLAGFGAGVAIGWSRAAHYWGHPMLRFIGPMPATAWLPLAFYFFSSNRTASTFLIALTTAFPVAVLTSSGVSSVNSAYYDIARTLGAKRRFLVLKVAIPAAMPDVFVGLFMGLGSSFAVLVVAEMLGVKAGLGYYLQWAQGWAAYANIYAALIVMSLLFSGLITLQFKVRNQMLAWQGGLLRW
jgi:NitT/TauT family transport system permease protein